MTLLEQAKSFLSQGMQVEVCRIIKTQGSSPRKAGASMFLTSTGESYGTIGGGNLEMHCQKLCFELLKNRTSRVYDFRLDGSQGSQVKMVCGGFVSVKCSYLSQLSSEKEIIQAFGGVQTSPLVWIFGTGHVGSEVGPLLAHVGFRVNMVDDRPEFADPALFPYAERTILCDYTNIDATVNIQPEDYVVIMTHGHIGDRDVLLHTCRINPTYIGCIGSHHKIAMTQTYLRENGISEEIINSIHAPIGIELYGDTPAEIGISVAAELIRHRAIANGLVQ